MAITEPAMEPSTRKVAFSTTNPVSGRAWSIIEATMAQKGLSRSRLIAVARASATAARPLIANNTLRSSGAR
ncbi:hypothetical protein D3C85_1883840 [compost metagenome]